MHLSIVDVHLNRVHAPVTFGHALASTLRPDSNAYSVDSLKARLRQVREIGRTMHGL